MRSGDVLAGKYRLERVLGEGATGQVWCATQLELDRQVALKVMHQALAGRRDAQLRFLREARVAACLHHPGAVRILDFGNAPAGMFLVMELLVGQTLRARLDEGPLPRALALELARQIAVVLEAAHQVNLVHRDIKPENTFLVARRGEAAQVKVVDFGLAFIADAQPSLGRLTADGVLGGTPAYMSPEQARGRAVGPLSDIYSLGCTLYELLAGQPPFVGGVTEVITRHAYAPAPPLRDLDLRPPAPAALDELVRAMLSKSPPLRPTAAHVLAALAALADGDGNRPGPLRLQPRSSRTPEPSAVRLLDDDEEHPPPLVLAVEGALDEETRLALAAGAIEVTPVGDGRATAVFAPGATLARLCELAAGGLPLFTDVDAGDFAGIAARVRAGCRAAVMRPVAPDTLIARLRRLAGPRTQLPGPLAPGLAATIPTPAPPRA